MECKRCGSDVILDDVCQNCRLRQMTGYTTMPEHEGRRSAGPFQMVDGKMVDLVSLETLEYDAIAKQEFDAVKKVKHYQVFPEHDIEAKHIIARLIDLAGFSPVDSVWYANALKYMLRLNRKGDPSVDRGKVKEYLGYMEE